MRITAMKSTTTVISTYPRSGKNFFVDLFKLKTGFHIPDTHLNGYDEKGHVSFLKNFEHVVTIIRNPIDSISSLITMEMTNHNLNYFDENTFSEVHAQWVINAKVNEYVNFYRQIKDNSTIVIDFDFFISNDDYVIDSVIDITKTPVLLSPMESQGLKNINSNFPRTSKPQPIYENVLKFVLQKESELTDCFNAFEDAKKLINLT